MRVIAGQWRSRVLLRPEGGQTRPMPDRLREAVFDIVGSWLGAPGRLPPITVADVFAGSGAVGLEALSRGAARCFFFERDPRALRTLRANLRSLEVGAEASVLAVDAWSDGLLSVPAEHPVGLLVLDPPYRDARDASVEGKPGRFLADAARSGRLADDVVALVHHEASVRYADFRPDWVCADCRQYGTHGLSFFRL